jgi:hypothetical protein
MAIKIRRLTRASRFERLRFRTRMYGISFAFLVTPISYWKASRQNTQQEYVSEQAFVPIFNEILYWQNRKKGARTVRTLFIAYRMVLVKDLR